MGMPTQASSRIGSSAIVLATVPTQLMAEVNTEPMEVSREATVTAGGVQQHSFQNLFLSKPRTMETTTAKQIRLNR